MTPASETQAAIAKMQAPRHAAVWQNANGSFSHYMNAQCEWMDRASCEMDLRLSREWVA